MSVIGLGTHFKQTTECFHILVNFWFIVSYSLLFSLISRLFLSLTAPFVAFFCLSTRIMWLLQRNQKLLEKWQMCLLQSSREVLLPQHISRVSYIYIFVFISFGVFLPSAHVQTDTYDPDLAEKTRAYLDVCF